MPALAQNDFRTRRNQQVPQHLVRRQPKPLVTVEENYAARLVLAVGYVQQQINQHIMPKVAGWVEQVQARRTDAHVKKPGSRGGHIIGYRHGEPIYGKSPVASAHGVKSVVELKKMANVALPKDDNTWEYFYHSFRHPGELEAVKKQGLHIGSAGKVWFSKDEIRDRNSGFVIVRIPKGHAAQGVDVIEPGLSFREWTTDKPVPPENIVRAVREIYFIGGGGHGIREDKLAAYAAQHQGTKEDLSNLPPQYQKWFHLGNKTDTLYTDVDEFEVIGQQFENIRINTQAREAPMSVATRQAVIQTATIVGVKNAANLAPILERLLGTDPFAHEPWLMPLSRNWVSENVSLIKSIGEKHLTEVEHLIYRMVRQGESIKTIRAELEARWGVTKNRARLIARDQVNKYNGQLTEERQTKAGINFYRWRNMQDRRVRGWPGGLYAKAVPSHAVMEGVLYRWDDATVYFDERARRWKKRTMLMEKLHPGAAIQCRCYAEPVLENV